MFHAQTDAIYTLLYLTMFLLCTASQQTVVYKDGEGSVVRTETLPIQPYTPQVLEDLLAVEALMAENDDEQVHSMQSSDLDSKTGVCLAVSFW